MYKACIFDLDGTLLDTIESIAVNVNKALAKYGFEPHEIEEYKHFVGDGQEKLIERSLIASGDTELKMFEEVSAEYKRIFAEGCILNVKPFDGIRELLDTLKSNGIKLAVLSNKNHENAVTSVHEMFGAQYFDFILGKKDGIKLKPDPQCVQVTLNGLNVDKSECVYIGDMLTDMLTGKGSGIFTVGVKWGFGGEEALRKGNADVIIDRPEQLLPIVLN